MLGDEICNDLDKLKLAKDVLATTEPVRSTLDRNIKVLEPSSKAGSFHLPNEFFTMTGEEVKKEQQLK